MDAKTQQSWVERMVRAINQAFPDVTDYLNWPACQQYLPHAQLVLQLADNWQLTLPEMGRLFNQMGYYLNDRAQYEQAEPLFQRAIAINEKALGPEHPLLAIYLNNLAFLYKTQGKFELAEPLYQRAIAIDEKVLGPEHPGLATDLNNLADLYVNQGKFELAEQLYQRAIAIYEKVLGPEHLNTKTIRENYAILLQEMNQKGREKQEP
jgi:tetratricopeptide (TPR) repeat protein